MNRLTWLTSPHPVWATLYLAVKKFWQIDGVQCAGAFAFNAFFSLFPLIVLFVTIASFWQGRYVCIIGVEPLRKKRSIRTFENSLA